MIYMKNLTKTYGRARGVTDLTLHVPAGSCFGFIGPNGQFVQPPPQLGGEHAVPLVIGPHNEPEQPRIPPDQVHFHLVPHFQGQEEIRLPEVVALFCVLLDAHLQGVLIEIQVQLPLVLEVVEQQPLGHPRPPYLSILRSKQHCIRKFPERQVRCGEIILFPEIADGKYAGRG